MNATLLKDGRVFAERATPIIPQQNNKETIPTNYFFTGETTSL